MKLRQTQLKMARYVQDNKMCWRSTECRHYAGEVKYIYISVQ